MCARDGTDHNNYLLGIRKNLLLLNASACHTEDGFDVGYACYICTYRSRIEDLYSGKSSADPIGPFCFPATCIKNDFIFRESVYRHSGFASSEANKQHFASQQNTWQETTSTSLTHLLASSWQATNEGGTASIASPMTWEWRTLSPQMLLFPVLGRLSVA